MSHTAGTAETVADAMCAKMRPTAIKRGRRDEWPYVPVIDHGTHTEQLRGLAYATRDEAVQRAVAHVEAFRKVTIARLKEPRHRSFREQHGLPADVAALKAGAS